MQKAWTIAVREYRAMVATKAFLLSITLMPILMFGGILIQSRLRNVGDTSDKTIVIVDGSDGALVADLERAVEIRNAIVAQISAASADDSATQRTFDPGPKYLLRRHASNSLTDSERLALSDEVRQEKIAAFVEIPSTILAGESPTPGATIQFYSQNPMLSPERQWVDRALNESITARRLEKLQIDASAVRQATRPVRVVPLGLFKKAADGSALGADESQNLAGMFVPFGFMMLMFMVIMLSAQPLIEGVMEEKSGRIAELLLGSVNTFQLMLGKLLGNVAGSLSVVAIYALGGYLLAAYNGWTHLVPTDLLPWFLVFQILAVLLFGSIFMAVGASVTQLKEAQSMLLPVWLLLVSPLFVWLPMVREPNGTLATWISFFPPAIPMAMVMRLASDAVIPWWQPIVGIVLLLATTLAVVYLAARVFRIGILWQGKTPRMGELVRWALRG